MGILFLLAMSSIGVYGVMLAGWSSGSKYPLLGSVRASAQMISYEAALGLTVVTVVLITGALSTRAIVDAQAGHLWQWNVIRLGVVPFVIFFIAIVAETNRPPFDLVEADTELVGGFVTEYSSIRFALFFLAEFMNTITMSAITVTLFFGGPDGPVPHIPHLYWLWPILWFLGKTIVFLFVFVWLRAALPRLRYDQLMDIGWKRLIPLSLGWLLIVAGFVIDGWWGLAMAAAVVVAAIAITRAFAIGPSARRRATRSCPAGAAFGCGPAPARPGSAPRPREVTADEHPEPPHQRQNFLGGFKLTLEHLGRPPVTRQYPEEKRPKQPRMHGRHVLNRYEDGMEKCIGCELCAGVCPADCIHVRGLDNPPDDPVSPASGTATSTRSTSCAASTATCAWRPARPRPSPSRS